MSDESSKRHDLEALFDGYSKQQKLQVEVQKLQADEQARQVQAKEFITKDSGQRQTFATGAQRDTQHGKGRFDLIPTEPLRRLAQLYERGAVKYGPWNWSKGIPLSRYLDSAMRHMNCLVAGEPEEDHPTAIVWNMFAYIWTLTEIEAGRISSELDDRPLPEPQYDSK